MCGLFDGNKGGFFLRKKQLECEASVYSNSKNALADRSAPEKIDDRSNTMEVQSEFFAHIFHQVALFCQLPLDSESQSGYIQ
jgi:hypothetical protein